MDEKTTKPAKGFLSRLGKCFFYAAATLAVVEGLYWLRDRGESGEPLTKNETALVQSIFGDELSTETLRKHFAPTTGMPYAEVKPSSRRHVTFYGDEYASDDFSQEDASTQGRFLHEMTHLWQNQSAWLLIAKVMKTLYCQKPEISFEDGALVTTTSSQMYDYQLDNNVGFDDFCTEQQGKIIQDYATYIFGAQNEKIDPHLVRVVEERFPQAKLTREKLEKNRQQPDLPAFNAL